jgi:hypothetical protein
MSENRYAIQNNGNLLKQSFSKKECKTACNTLNLFILKSSAAVIVGIV